jgi:16S rRNA (guanine527-N7)-methyltransferase
MGIDPHDEPTEDLHQVLSEARRLGFLGDAEVSEQIGHAMAFVRTVASWTADGDIQGITDLGSGGGVPALVVATALSNTSLTLVEGSATRADFLVWAVGRLGLADRVSVYPHPAEVAGRDKRIRGCCDIVTARGFGPPAMTAECAAPLLRSGGYLIVSEPPGGSAHRWAPGCEMLGMELAEVQVGPPAMVVLRLSGQVEDRFPRRTGIPRRRPLF